MSWWLWVAYSAMCAGVFLYPSRLNLATAQLTRSLGRKSGFAAAFGVATGTALSLTLASLLFIAYLSYNEKVSSTIEWLSLSWLILLGFWTIGTVPHRLALVDNDNLRSKTHSASLAKGLSDHALSLKIFGFFLAALVQVYAAYPQLTAADIINLKIATFALAFLCQLFFVFYPEISINWLRSIAAKLAQRRPDRKTIIQGKYVKARYRKMAA